MDRRFATLSVAVVTTATLGIALAHAGSSDASRAGYGIGGGVSAHRAAAVTSPTAPKTTAPKTSAPKTTAPTTTSAPASTAAPAATTSAPKPSGTPVTATAAASSPSLLPPALGTLVTNADRAATESDSGVKVAMLEFKWQYLEPSRGYYNQKYATSMYIQLKKFQAAGMRITLGLGLHYPPQWVLDLAGSRMRNQYGASSSQIDLVFNQQLRVLANEYLAMIDRAVGFENFWAVRVSSGGMMELLYPSTAYWAYSGGAQNSANKPPTMAANPMPGWKPGDPATSAQRDAWARWYVGALDDVADWQMDQAQSLGFDGYFQILTPGQGLRPKQYNQLVANGLTDGTLGRGAVWQFVYANLQHRTHISAFVTSVGEQLLNTDTCQPDDASVPLNADAAFYWSTSRWISRLADEYGFTVAGEVPGFSGGSASTSAYYRDTSSTGMMAMAMAQARSCGFISLYWAHDDQLWNGTVPFSAFASYTSPAALAPAAVK